jgi:hypothetical protein
MPGGSVTAPSTAGIASDIGESEVAGSEAGVHPAHRHEESAETTRPAAQSAAA